MSLVINVFAESWGIAGITLCQINDCIVRLNQAQFANVYMGMWQGEGDAS